MKKLLFLFTCILLFSISIISCSKKTISHPYVNNTDGTIMDDDGSVSYPEFYPPTPGFPEVPPSEGSGSEGGTGGDNGESGGTEETYTPEYPGDPGPDYGDIIPVVTPKILLDNNTWGTEWKVRERDYKRISFMWGQILSSFEGDRIGLGIVFGAGVAFGTSAWKNHADFKYVRPTDMRLYQTVNNNRNYDLKQPFHKYSQDYNTHKFQSTHTAKFFKYGVIVKVGDRAGWQSTSWTGRYTIGGVYNSPTRLAYGTENNLQTAEDKDDEIYVIRMDRPWTHNGLTYYRIQLLFKAAINNTKDEIAQNRIWSYSDFDKGMNDRPEYSEYIWATKAMDATSLKRKP